MVTTYPLARLHAWLDTHQIPIYVASIIAGAVLAIVTPQFSENLEPGLTPIIMGLLFVTFMAIPLTGWKKLAPPPRFIATILIANFLLNPIIVWLVTRGITDNGLLIGATIVLLAPCIDYVIAFTGLAGGDASRLLATTPLLLIVQALLIPVYLKIFGVVDLVQNFDLASTLTSAVAVLLIPLLLAFIAQYFPNKRVATSIDAASDLAMVPFMIATLSVATAVFLPSVLDDLHMFAGLFLRYVGFAVISGIVTWWLSKLARLDRAAAISTTFSAVTRNSLVVLPVAIAISAGMATAAQGTQTATAPLAVISQTLTELIIMLALIKIFQTTWRKAKV